MTENLEHFTWFANKVAELKSINDNDEQKAKAVYEALLHYENNLTEDERKDLFFYMLGAFTWNFEKE